MATLHFFGRLRDVAGTASRDAELPQHVATGAELIDWLGRADAPLGAALADPSIRIAVNQKMALDRSAAVEDGDEIAFMPPMSGG